MKEVSSNSIRHMVERIPQWLRADLSSTDPMLRGRAEDALFAMIVAATDSPRTVEAPSPPIDEKSAAPTSM